MAGHYDGSIRINTKIDNSGFRNGLKEQEVSAKAQAAKIAAQYKKQGMSASEAFKKAWSEVKRDSKEAAQKSSAYWKESANDSKRYVGDISTGFNSLMGTLGKLAIVVGGIFGIVGFFSLGQEAIDLASDIQEVDNVVSKSFGNMRAEMDALADTAIEKLGMSRLTAYQTGSTFMAMGKSMVDSMTDAKDMALSLTALTGHMASFFNVSQDIAATALKSIYTGETETLKQFGVVMTEANLQQFAYAQGIKKTLAAMTQSEKVMLRYRYVMEQLSFIGEDFTDTQDSWANQTRILTEQWKELLSILGSGLITVLTPVVKGLNAMLSSLIEVVNAIGKVMTTVFGLQAQQLSMNAGSAEDAAGAMEDYGNATEAAAKKAQKALASFDDLNVLQSSSASGGGGSDFSIGDIETSEIEAKEGMLKGIEKESSEFLKMLEQGAQMVKNIIDDFSVGDFFKAGQDTSTLITSIFDFFADAIEGVDWKELGNNIGDFLAGIEWLKIFKSLKDVVVEAIEAAADTWFGALEEAPFETALITAIALWKLTGVGSEIGGKVKEQVPGTISASTILKIAVALEFVWAATMDIAKALAEWSNEEYGYRFDTSKEIKISDLFEPENISVGLEWGTLDAISATIFGFEDFDDLVEYYLEFVILPGIEDLAEGIKEDADKFFEGIGDWLYESIWVPIDDFFTDLFEEGSTWIRDGLIGYLEKFDEWEEDLGEFWDGLVERLTLRIQEVLDNFQAMVDGALSIFQPLADFLNGILGTVEQVGGLLGSRSSFSYSSEKNNGSDTNSKTTAQYPALAKGAVFRGGNPYLAIVNDQPAGQTNIEAPLATIEQAVQNVMAEGNFGSKEIVIRFEGTPAQMVRQLRPYIVQEDKRIGTNFRKK